MQLSTCRWCCCGGGRKAQLAGPVKEKGRDKGRELKCGGRNNDAVVAKRLFPAQQDVSSYCLTDEMTVASLAEALLSVAMRCVPAKGKKKIEEWWMMDGVVRIQCSNFSQAPSKFIRMLQCGVRATVQRQANRLT